jgi:ketosteroid isomerase-like protein
MGGSMTKFNSLLILIIIALGVTLATNNRGAMVAGQDEVARINQLYEDWFRAVEEGDIPLYLSVLDPEIELIPTDADPIKATANYGEFLVGVFASNRFKIERLGDKEIEVREDLAYARYDYNIIRTDVASGKVYESKRNFVDVLRKNSDGDWHVFKHIWNYTTPDVTP